MKKAVARRRFGINLRELLKIRGGAAWLAEQLGFKDPTEVRRWIREVYPPPSARFRTILDIIELTDKEREQLTVLYESSLIDYHLKKAGLSDTVSENLANIYAKSFKIIRTIGMRKAPLIWPEFIRYSFSNISPLHGVAKTVGVFIGTSVAATIITVASFWYITKDSDQYTHESNENSVDGTKTYGHIVEESEGESFDEDASAP